MNNHGLGRLVETFKTLPIPGRIIVVVLILVGVLILATFVGVGSVSVWKWNYNRKEAANQKLIQEALANAEAKDKSADAKEAKVEQIGQINEKRAGDTAARVNQINQETEKNVQAIEDAYKRDSAYINSDISSCDRCRDICSRVERLSLSNPDLGKYRCGPDTCASECADQ